MVAFSCVAVRGKFSWGCDGKEWRAGGKREAVAPANDKSYERANRKGVIYKEESRSRLSRRRARLSLSLSVQKGGGEPPFAFSFKRAQKRHGTHKRTSLHPSLRASRVEFNYRDLANSLRALVRWSDKSRPRPRPMRFYRCDRRYFWACCATEKEGPRGTKKKLGRNRFAEPIDEEIKFGGALYRSGSLNTICCKLSVSKLWY